MQWYNETECDWGWRRVRVVLVCYLSYVGTDRTNDPLSSVGARSRNVSGPRAVGVLVVRGDDVGSCAFGVAEPGRLVVAIAGRPVGDAGAQR